MREHPTPPNTEPKSPEPERSIEAPSLIWWMLAIVVIALFVGLAWWFAR